MTVDRQKYFSAEEMSFLRQNAAENAQKGSKVAKMTWLCVDFALQTGLRVNEIARVTVRDIDLRACTIRVWRSKRRTEIRETIGMSPSLRAHLRAHLADMGCISPETSIWQGRRGAWGKRGLQEAWARACRAADLPRISIHGARHSLAVHLYRNTRDLRTVQKQLGHSSPETTAAYYADVPFEDQLEALKGVFG